jgi:quercetin dioxygenase-like cupin family protein
MLEAVSEPTAAVKPPQRGGVIRAADMQGYSPANHSGTTNFRLIGPHNGAKYMEVLIGEFVPGGNALAHAHPALEQAVYILEGTAVAGIDGVDHEVAQGDVMFFPEGVFHSLKVTSPKLRLLVMYAPPYGEDPGKVIR